MARTQGFWDSAGGNTYLKTSNPLGYDLLINGSNHYINFGTTNGSSGYGIRDNAGVMEVKASGGSWAPIEGTQTDDGTAAGQMLFWDNSNSKWTYTEDTELYWNDTHKVLQVGSNANPLSYAYAREKLVVKDDTGGTTGTAMVMYNDDSNQILGNELLMLTTVAARGNAFVMAESQNNRAWGFGNVYLNSDTFQIGYIPDYTAVGTFKETETMRSTNGLFFIDGANGNVGIGADLKSPVKKLEILDSSAEQLRLTYTVGSVYTDIQTTSNGELYINPSGVSVGVGTSNPVAILEAHKASSGYLLRLTNDGTAHRMSMYISGSLSIWSTDNGGDVRFSPGGLTNYLVHLDASDQYVGIGTTGPDRKLDILDASNPQLRLTHTDGSVYVDQQCDSSGYFTISPTGGSVIFPQGAAASPAVAFGDGDSGLFESADDTIQLSLAGIAYWNWGASQFGAIASTRPILRNEDSSSTNPTFVFVNDTDTGIGRAAADQLSLIAGGVEGIRVSEATSISINMGLADSDKTYWGAGSDAYIEYDGTDMKIVTDAVAASDLIVDCGTDKTIELAETVYKDENFSGFAAGATANVPDAVAWDSGTIYARAFDGNATTEQLFAGAELQHDYKEGTDLVFHIHWAPTTANSGNVKWQLTYTIERDNTGTIASGTLSAVDAADGTAWVPTRVDLGTVTGTSLQIGDQIQCRLFRDPSDGDDTYGDDAALAFTFGYHYEVNTLGSRQIGTK